VLRAWLKSGTMLVVGLGAIFAFGWVLYEAFIPPRWLHDFAGDIAYRAAPDPNAPPPRDSREAKPFVQPPHPYICAAKIIPFAWDRMVVVPSSGDPRIVSGLEGVDWSKAKAEEMAARMEKDPRYQLILFVKDNKVVADAIFFTFWGNLAAIARPEGLTPDTAAFTAVVKEGTHVLSVAEPFPDVCKGPPA
jgi:hypothetical protein